MVEVASALAGKGSGVVLGRPRDRIFDPGPGAMSDAELLGVLLGTGAGGQSAQQSAEELLQRFEGVAGLGRAHVLDLRDARGVGVAKAAVLAAAMELGRRSMRPNPERPRLRYAHEVDRHYRPKLAHLNNEVFHVACLDVRNRLVRDARVAQGGFASCAILPREVFAPAMRDGCVGVVLVHNHPSGESEPSQDDLTLTSRLVHAGEVLGVKVVDHVIIAANGYTSLATAGHLPCVR